MSTDTSSTTDERLGTPPEGDWLGTPKVRFERHGSLAHCIIDRPERRNALTGTMYYAIRYAVGRVNSDDSLAGLLITGTGDVFIPGGDLGGDTADHWPGLETMGMDILPFDSIRRSFKPVVSAINGLCQGGGLLIAMASDMSVASDRATFRAPELFRGIADTGYASYLPAQIGPARAKDMLYTGRVVNAVEAEEWGLINRTVPDADVMDAAVDVLEWCCRCGPDSFREVKRIIAETHGAPDRMTMQASLASAEPREGMMAFMEKRNPSWIADDLKTDGRL